MLPSCSTMSSQAVRIVSLGVEIASMQYNGQKPRSLASRNVVCTHASAVTPEKMICSMPLMRRILKSFVVAKAPYLCSCACLASTISPSGGRPSTLPFHHSHARRFRSGFVGCEQLSAARERQLQDWDPRTLGTTADSRRVWSGYC